MADLTRRGDDRGQLIVVAAIGLAILLVLLALALNTAAFGEIHAAQTGDSLQDERGATQYLDSVERGIGGLIVPIDEEHDEYETLEDELEDGIERWHNVSRSEYTRDGVVTNVSLVAVTYETRIVQDESRNFTDRDGNTTWDVAANVSDVRGFEMNVTDEDLVETDDCTGGSECFRLDVDGADGSSWTLFVYDHDVDGVTITVDSPSHGVENHSTTGTQVEINVSDGVFDVGGSEAEFETFLEDEGIEAPYDLTYANADNVNGTYEIEVDGKIVEETIEDDERYGTAGSPRIEAGIDSAELAVWYRSSGLTYGTETEIRPGENDA